MGIFTVLMHSRLGTKSPTKRRVCEDHVLPLFCWWIVIMLVCWTRVLQSRPAALVQSLARNPDGVGLLGRIPHLSLVLRVWTNLYFAYCIILTPDHLPCQQAGVTSSFSAAFLDLSIDIVVSGMLEQLIVVASFNGFSPLLIIWICSSKHFPFEVLFLTTICLSCHLCTIVDVFITFLTLII